MGTILILANNDVGLYKFRKELIQELISKGNEVFISIPHGDYVKPLVDLGCNFIDTDVDRRGINPITDCKLFFFYVKLLRKIQPHLVITYTIKPNIYGGFASRINRIRYAVNITGLGTAFQRKGFLKIIVKSLYKIACKKTQVVFFENEENRRVFIENKIVKEEHTCRLNGAGVNLDEYEFCDYPKESGPICFLFIGRVMQEKGVNELFDAAKRIKAEHEDVEFDIVGPMEENYKSTINELQKQNIINYHGYTTDVKPYIRKTNCFVLPSYHEGMANTLLECGAMGRPLITSNIPGCKEAVVDGESGFLVDAKDADDLYSKMKKFINLPSHEKRTMAFNSRVHIEKEFCKKKVIKKTLTTLLI